MSRRRARGPAVPYTGTLPVPGQPGRTIRAVALELPGDRFVALHLASDEHYADAAELATTRLRRCKPGSLHRCWYRAVVAEGRRRRRGRLTVVAGEAR